MSEVILDLGCGTNLFAGAIGVDLVTQPHSSATVACNLGFEVLPFNDDFADLIVCRHIIEHIPDCVWIKHDDPVPNKKKREMARPGFERLQPTVFLFNEIWRVLKHKGRLYIELPIVNPDRPASLQPVFQDPTHVSFWPLEKFNYFSGDYYGKHDIYGHSSRFWWDRKQTTVQHGWMAAVELVAIKNLPPDAPYTLEYNEILKDAIAS